MRLNRIDPALLLSMAMLASASSGCWQKPQMSGEPLPPLVRVAAPKLRQVTDYKYFTGRTEAVESVDVRARVTGYLVAIDFKPGQKVSQSDRLFIIDPRPYQAKLDEAKSQVDLSRAQLKLAKANYARALVVAKTPGAVSQQELDRLSANEQEAEAGLAVAEANRESAQLFLQFTNVESPIDGVVGRNLLTIGNLVQQDATLLTTIVSQDPIYAYFDVDELTVLKVRDLIRKRAIEVSGAESQYPVEIGLANEADTYPHHGHVDFVNIELDPSTGTQQVRGVFANPKPPIGPRPLEPGLFVRIRLAIGPPFEAITIPQAAVSSEQNVKYVLVVNSDNIVEQRRIELGRQLPDGTQVVLPFTGSNKPVDGKSATTGKKKEKPLSQHDQIIVGGLQRVRPGSTVRIQPADSSKSGGHSIEDPAPDARESPTAR